METDRDRPLNFLDIKAAIERTAAGGLATTPALHPKRLLQHWLWGCDSNEVCDKAKCDFHEAHLTGMVMVRVLTEAYSEESSPLLDQSDIDVLNDIPGIFLPHFVTDDGSNRAIVPEKVSLQKLHDITHALQMSYPLLQRMAVQSDERLQLIERLITQVFIWVGVYIFSDGIQEWQADDNEFIDDVPVLRDNQTRECGGGAPVATRKLVLTGFGIKFYLNTFYVLFRLLFLERHATPVPVIPEGKHPFAIEKFHVEASVDDYHLIGMYQDIPPGCLLEYKHSYAGYFNSVSQVVYRHFPAYKRRKPVSLEEIEVPGASDLSVLPSLKQIYPEIEYAFEDHHFHREVAGIRSAVLLVERGSIGDVNMADPAPVGSTTVGPTPAVQNPVSGGGSRRGRRTLQPNKDIEARITACKGGVQASIDAFEALKFKKNEFPPKSERTDEQNELVNAVEKSMRAMSAKASRARVGLDDHRRKSDAAYRYHFGLCDTEEEEPSGDDMNERAMQDELMRLIAQDEAGSPDYEREFRPFQPPGAWMEPDRRIQDANLCKEIDRLCVMQCAWQDAMDAHDTDKAIEQAGDTVEADLKTLACDIAIRKKALGYAYRLERRVIDQGIVCKSLQKQIDRSNRLNKADTAILKLQDHIATEVKARKKVSEQNELGRIHAWGKKVCIETIEKCKTLRKVRALAKRKPPVRTLLPLDQSHTTGEGMEDDLESDEGGGSGSEESGSGSEESGSGSEGSGSGSDESGVESEEESSDNELMENDPDEAIDDVPTDELAEMCCIPEFNARDYKVFLESLNHARLFLYQPGPPSETATILQDENRLPGEHIIFDCDTPWPTTSSILDHAVIYPIFDAIIRLVCISSDTLVGEFAAFVRRVCNEPTHNVRTLTTPCIILRYMANAARLVPHTDGRDPVLEMKRFIGILADVVDVVISNDVGFRTSFISKVIDRKATCSNKDRKTLYNHVIQNANPFDPEFDDTSSGYIIQRIKDEKGAISSYGMELYTIQEHISDAQKRAVAIQELNVRHEASIRRMY
ncbi:hypothetical protein T484DRAFT_1744568 [Baffinella frigidus]|nr:hypothetical protein T484DRAFT_1744568 [Cryptophyta sp. CCMP2293]